MAEHALADGDLVAGAQQGDVGAYATLIQRYQPLAVGLAAVVTRNPAEAEDVAQEAFVKAYYALDRFTPGASFRAWLVRIVVNEARNAGAAARRRVDLHARFREQAAAPARDVSAEESALANEQQAALVRALDGLRDDDRSVLMLRYVFDLNEAEMAEALVCSRGTVKSRLSRALARLRNDLSRVAPLLAVSPGLTTLTGQTLAGAAAPGHGLSAQALAEAVLRRIASGGPPPAGAPANGRPTGSQVAAASAGGIVVLALAAAGLLLANSGSRALPAPPAEATQPPALSAVAVVPASSPSPAVFIMYGGELTDAERLELSRTFSAGQQATAESVTRDELVGTLQASGLPVDGTERAISSAMVTCLSHGDGLRVRTQNVTELPSAAYANALVTAGVVDAAVVVAAPPSTPMTGETALVGVLKAFPRCHSGQPAPPERLRLAYDQLRATAEMAQTSAAWDRAAKVMLRGAQVAIGTHSPDEVALGAAVDEAASAEGLALDAPLRAGVISVLSRLSQLDHGAYAAGYAIESVAPDEVRVVPNSGSARASQP